MKKTRAEKPLPKNRPRKRVGSGRLVSPSLSELLEDSERARTAWSEDYRKHGLGTGNHWRVPLRDRLKNNGLWRRWKNRQKKYELAYKNARSANPTG